MFGNAFNWFAGLTENDTALTGEQNSSRKRREDKLSYPQLSAEENYNNMLTGSLSNNNTEVLIKLYPDANLSPDQTASINSILSDSGFNRGAYTRPSGAPNYVFADENLNFGIFTPDVKTPAQTKLFDALMSRLVEVFGSEPYYQCGPENDAACQAKPKPKPPCPTDGLTTSGVTNATVPATTPSTTAGTTPTTTPSTTPQALLSLCNLLKEGLANLTNPTPLEINTSLNKIIQTNNATNISPSCAAAGALTWCLPFASQLVENGLKKIAENCTNSTETLEGKDKTETSLWPIYLGAVIAGIGALSLLCGCVAIKRSRRRKEIAPLQSVTSNNEDVETTLAELSEIQQKLDAILNPGYDPVQQTGPALQGKEAIFATILTDIQQIAIKLAALREIKLTIRQEGVANALFERKLTLENTTQEIDLKKYKINKLVVEIQENYGKINILLQKSTNPNLPKHTKQEAARELEELGEQNSSLELDLENLRREKEEAINSKKEIIGQINVLNEENETLKSQLKAANARIAELEQQASETPPTNIEELQLKIDELRKQLIEEQAARQAAEAERAAAVDEINILNSKPKVNPAFITYNLNNDFAALESLYSILNFQTLSRADGQMNSHKIAKSVASYKRIEFCKNATEADETINNVGHGEAGEFFIIYPHEKGFRILIIPRNVNNRQDNLCIQIDPGHVKFGEDFFRNAFDKIRNEIISETKTSEDPDICSQAKKLIFCTSELDEDKLRAHRKKITLAYEEIKSKLDQVELGSKSSPVASKA